MYYIVVVDAGVQKVVSNKNGIPRSFPKEKAAKNYIDSRDYLVDRNARIVDDITEIPYRFKVDI